VSGLDVHAFLGAGKSARAVTVGRWNGKIGH